MPGERTFRRLFKALDPEPLKEVLASWMKQQDPAPLEIVHLDGKVVKNAAPAPARSPVATAPQTPPPEPCEIPLALQKPKADETLDKGHGRIETRRLWSQPIEPATLGLAEPLKSSALR